MASIRKKGRNWQAIIRINKRNIYRTFKKKSDASKWASEFETSIGQGLYVDNLRLNTIRLKEMQITRYGICRKQSIREKVKMFY